MKRIRGLSVRSLICVTCATLASHFSAPAVGTSVYHVGNSLTHGLDVSQIAIWANSRGHTYAAGRHINQGANLDHIWTSQAPSQFPIAPYGSFYDALPNFDWDAITLQPMFDTVTTSSARIQDFRALEPDADVFIYQTWPRYQWGDYAVAWDGIYTGGVANNMTRSYFHQLMSGVDPSHRLIPFGEVLYEIDKAIKAGQFPTIDSIVDLYVNDGCTCHLNDLGYIAVNSTYYATLFNETPVGLPNPGFSTEISNAFQRIAWQVVLDHEFSGVTGDYNHDGVVDAADYTVWRNTDGMLEGYQRWKADFGLQVQSAMATTTPLNVPEPRIGMLICAALPPTIYHSRRRRNRRKNESKASGFSAFVVYWRVTP